MHIVCASIALLVAALVNQQSGGPSLDYETYKAKMCSRSSGEAPRPRSLRRVPHSRPPLLQPLAKGSTTWTEDETKKNFAAVMERAALPGNAKSLLLIHPLEESAGGDFYHSGGKHWSSQNDPEWQTLRALVMGKSEEKTMTKRFFARGSPVALVLCAVPLAAQQKLRIIQTNSAGDNVHLIDPATNKIVGEISGIEAGHGAGASPDGKTHLRQQRSRKHARHRRCEDAEGRWRTCR